MINNNSSYPFNFCTKHFIALLCELGPCPTFMAHFKQTRRLADKTKGQEDSVRKNTQLEHVTSNVFKPLMPKYLL